MLGLLTGSVATAWLHHPAPPLALLDDPGTDVPVVRIEGIKDSALVGTALGNVRLFAGGDAVTLDASGAFAIRNTKVLTNVITLQKPAGMNFVASKRGKKYYAITSAQAQQIVPENRVYFPDAQSAERAGYTR